MPQLTDQALNILKRFVIAVIATSMYCFSIGQAFISSANGEGFSEALEIAQAVLWAFIAMYAAGGGERVKFWFTLAFVSQCCVAALA